MDDFSILSSRKSIQIHVAGRFVGEVAEGIFKKTITGSRHILQKPPSIALSVESLEQAERAGAREIQIKDRETGQLFSCTIDHFKHHAFPLQRGGFEPQLAMRLEEFDVTSPLEISSHAPKRGEIKRKPGNGERVRNPHGLVLVSPRQLVLKGMM